VNGDIIRDLRIMSRGSGYDTSQVDDLLRRIAVELDAGRPAGPVIENATLRTRAAGRPYDIDAVDWFLDELLLRPGHAGLAGSSADPWRDLAIAQLTRGGVDPTKRARNRRRYFSEEFQDAWRNFGQQPSAYLRWGRVKGVVRPSRWEFELRTADQQAIASFRGWPLYRASAGGRSFTVNATKIPARSIPDTWPPNIAELAARTWRDQTGHFATKTMSSGEQRGQARRVSQLVDETGIPILYVHGLNFNRRAYACITFPDQRWLRFLVRGTRRANAIMTAVDQEGNIVARYRKPSRDRPRKWGSVEITVNPGRKLTDELVLAIAISVPMLDSYFHSPSGGG